MNATAICDLCRLSYAKRGETFGMWADRVRDQIAGNVEGCSDLRFYSQSGAEAFLAVGSEVAVLVHRGTSAVDDWVDNGLALKTYKNAFGDAGIYTHYGATTAGARIWQDCGAAVCKAAVTRPVIHAGHSRGGAIANDTAARSIADGAPVQRLVTFGAHRYASPRGARLLARLLHGRIRRFAHQTDPVPLLPLPVCYRHAGRVIYIDSSGRAHRAPTWRYMLIDQLRIAYRDLIEGGVQTDDHHTISQYYKAIRTAEAAGGDLLK